MKKFCILISLTISFCSIKLGQTSININTTFGSANSLQSYVFGTQQTIAQSGEIIGDVELRAGLLAANDNLQCVLGMTPPLSGELQIATGGAFASYNLVSDLTLGSVTFGGLATNPINNGTRTFDFNFTGTYSIRLLKDVFLSNLTYFQLNSSQGGILDGGGNKLTIDDTNITTSFVPSALVLNGTGFPGALTLKNIYIEGIASDAFFSSNFQVADSTYDIFFENVTLAAYRSQLAFIDIINNTFRYFGQNNVIGFGGTVQFACASFTPISLFKIMSFARVHVTPLTTLRLSTGNPFPVPVSVTVNFEDTTAELFLDNCTVDVGQFENMTVSFLGGTVTIKGNVNFTNSSGPGTNNKLILGDGVNQSNNCNIQILPGSKLIIDDNLQFVNMNI